MLGLNDLDNSVSGSGLTRMGWRWIVPIGALAGVVPQFLTLVTIYAWAAVLVFLLQGTLYFPGFVPSSVSTAVGAAPVPQFVVEGAEWNDEINRFAYVICVFGQPFVHLLCSGVAASVVVRKVEASPIRHGLLVGLVSVIGMIVYLLAVAFSSRIVSGIFIYEIPEELVRGNLSFVGDRLANVGIYLPPGELALYSVLGLGGGLLGGLDGRAILADRTAIYRASRDVSMARSPHEVAAAIGENLADPDTEGITLWEAVPGDVPTKLAPVGSWWRGGDAPWPPGWSLEAGRLPGSANLERRSSVSLRTRELPAAERGVWEERGARSLLLVPLVFPGGRSTPGLLVVASRKARGFSGGAVRAYLTASAQAASVLENLHLVEKASQAGVLQERQRLSQEIHDTLAQGFTSIVTNLEAAEGALAKDTGEVRRYHERIGRTARESLAEARRLVWALRPEPLEDAPLPEVLRRLTERWSASSGVAAEAVVTGEPRPLPAEVEVTLLRVAQEALANVLKHARASRAALTLSYMGDTVVLDVRDDGRGFDPSRMPADSPEGGFGLKGMRRRVEHMGGTLSIESTLGEGATLVAELPAAGPTDPKTRSPEPAREAP